jgi:hypothetical protein
MSRNGRPDTQEPLSDRESAKLVVRIAATRQSIDKRLARRITPEWGEACLLAEQDGEAGLTAWLQVEQVRLQGDPERFAVLAAALEQAKVEGPSAEVPGDEPPEPPPFRLAPLGAIALAHAAYRLCWRVERILVADQPGVVGAPKKSLKTSTMVDLAVSLASALYFLGYFRVPERVPVYLLSGESGGFIIQETVRRVCLAKGIDLESLEGFLFVEDKLPQLGIRAHLDELARVIRELGIKVVIVDPLYLCLLCGIPGRKLDASNLFDMGPLLLAIAKTCLDLGATPLLVHHFRKTGSDPYELPELEDLAFAGIQEFARQWILLKRRERYEPGTGEHRLWLSVGGSAGHSGEWALDVHEGTMDLDFQGRRWAVEVKPVADVRSLTAEQKLAAKVEQEAERARVKAETQDHADATAVAELVAKLRDEPDRSATRKRIREITGWRDDRAGRVLARGERAGTFRPAMVSIPSGHSRTKEVPGYRLADGPEVIL